jgi:choline dehydrogenase-like flavoprotein
MAHFFGIFASIAPDNSKDIVYNFERDQEKVYCRRRWWITEKIQTEKKIGNAIFFLHKANDQEGHRDALFSAVFVTKFILSLISDKSISKAKFKWTKNKTEVSAHFGVIFKEGWKQLPTMIGVASKRFQKRRLPFVLPPVNSKTLGLYFQTEQIPNPESRITISENEFDNLGIPRAIVNIEFTEMDKKTIIESHRIFIERYIKAGIGSIIFTEEKLIQFIEKKILNFNSSAHHLGTTRMSNDPLIGVVDENCKVHGVNNLFIAGSSVFTTGSHVNPTLTLVALAVRLGKFLKREYKNE